MKEKIVSRRKRRPGKLRPWWQSILAPTALGALSLLAFFGAHKPPPRVEIVSEEETILLPVPQRQIARGEKLSNVPFLSTKWPKSKVSPDYIRSTTEHQEAYALSPLPAHLPVPLSGLTTTPPATNVVAESIAPGMRAITVRVDAESAVEGWARSGSFIDVILVRTSKEGLESLIVAENVRILSAGSSAQPTQETTAKAPTTVTLLVSQEDALRIKTAANLGKLTFALRGIGDTAPALTLTVDQKRLLGQTEVKTPELIGKAKGPDGKTYILSKNSKWFRTGEDHAR